MDTHTTTNASIEERIHRLEQENRRLRQQCRWTQVIAITIGGFLLFMGASASKTSDTAFQNLTVQHLTIEDDSGIVRGKLGIDSQGGVAQTFFDAKGTQRILSVIEPDGTARQRLFDDEGKVRISSSTFPSDHETAAGSAGQVFYDKDGNKRIRIATNAEGFATQQFNDTDGQHRIETTVSPDGTVNQ